MASTTPSMTKTDKNLWSAIVAEAMAYLKYNAYSHRALEEGHPEVAQVFQEVAGAETIHGMNHLRVAGGLKDTLVNLRTVTEGESREYSIMYPKMIQDALDEGRQEAADSFALAMDRERHHLEVFTNALQLLEAKTAAAAAAGEPLASTPAQTFVPAPGTGLGITTDGMDMATYVSAATEIDRERWRVARLGRLREVVFGAQDGLLSTVALVTSVAVAVDNQTIVLVAGFSSVVWLWRDAEYQRGLSVLAGTKAREDRDTVIGALNEAQEQRAAAVTASKEAQRAIEVAIQAEAGARGSEAEIKEKLEQLQSTLADFERDSGCGPI